MAWSRHIAHEVIRHCRYDRQYRGTTHVHDGWTRQNRNKNALPDMRLHHLQRAVFRDTGMDVGAGRHVGGGDGMTVNIALCSSSFRAGKDTVGEYLVANYGYMRFAFADEMKRYAHEIFNVKPTPKPRALYQFFGEAMREYDPIVWIRMVENAISGCRMPAVITDMRLPLEHHWARYYGYTIIRVNAPLEIRLERARLAGDVFDESTLAHDTESHVDGFDVDYEIVNDGTLDELFLAVDAVMAKLTEVTLDAAGI
jgi:dephospho-CoA kinase